jgi:hypothetical protein
MHGGMGQNVHGKRVANFATDRPACFFEADREGA